MRVTIVGKRHLDYKSRKTGNQVTGDQIHVLYQDRNVEGNAVSNYFVNPQLAAAIGEPIRIGEQYEIYFNQFGSLDMIRPI